MDEQLFREEELKTCDITLGSNSSVSIDFSKVARRPRTSPFSEVSLDEALSIIFAITSEMPIVEKSFKGNSNLLNIKPCFAG